MSERNSDGFDKSRSVLGDVTNRLGKRGFSEREKRGVKHVRVSPRHSADLDLLKRDVTRISKVSAESNEGLKGKELDSCGAFSERSIDVKAELTCGYGNSDEINCKNAAKLGENKAETPGVNPMFAVDNGSVNTLGDPSSSVHDGLPMRDEISSRNCEDPNFTDLVTGTVIGSVDSKPGGRLPLADFDSFKGYKLSEIPDAVTENTSPNAKATVKSNVVDVARNHSGDVVSNMAKISKSSHLNLLDLGRHNAFMFANIEDKNKLAKVSLEGTQKSFINSLHEVEGHNADNYIMSQSDSFNCAILPDSQESRIFGVEQSYESKKCKEYPYTGGGADAIKTCSCSFCTKAAYIWLDLNYQDIRGRVSAMRKSQKEASIFAERSRMAKEKETEKHDAEGSNQISELEIDLMHQWRFLFQHMAGIWEQEGDDLETSLSPLTDLREKCKRDLSSD